MLGCEERGLVPRLRDGKVVRVLHAGGNDTVSGRPRDGNHTITSKSV
jgi:hypothetical protein